MLTKLDSAVLNLMDIIDMEEEEEVPSPSAAREDLSGDDAQCNSFVFRAAVIVFIENRILDMMWSYFLSNYSSVSCLKNYSSLSLTLLSSSIPLPLTASWHSILCEFYGHVSFSYRNELYQFTNAFVTPSPSVISATPMDLSSYGRLGSDLSRTQEMKAVNFTPSSQGVATRHILILSSLPRSILKKRCRGEGEGLISLERQHTGSMKRVRFDSSSCSGTSRPLKQLSWRNSAVIGRKRVCIRQQQQITPLQFEKKRMLESINCRYHQLISMELQHEGGGGGGVMSMPLLVDSGGWRGGGVDEEPIGGVSAAADDDDIGGGEDSASARQDLLFDDSVGAGLKLMHCVTLNTFKNSSAVHSSHQLVVGRSAAVAVGRRGMVVDDIRRTSAAIVQSVGVSHADVDLEALTITSPAFTYPDSSSSNSSSSSSPYNATASYDCCPSPSSPSSETSSTCSDDEFYRMFDDE